MSDEKFPHRIEIAAGLIDVATRMASTGIHSEWVEIGIYQLVRIKRVRWVPEEQEV